MRQRKITVLREFLATQANHWIFLPLLMILTENVHPSAWCLLGWVMVGFLPILLFTCREIIQSTLLQFFLVVIYAGIVFFLPMEPEITKGICGFFVMAYMMQSLFKVIKKEEKLTHAFPPFVPLAINFVLCAIALFTTGESASFFMHLSAILSVMCSILAFYLDRYLHFTNANEGTSSNMPKGKIFRSGMQANLKFLGAISALLFLIASFAISDEFFRKIYLWNRNGLKKILQWIASLFTRTKRDTHILDGMNSATFDVTAVPAGQTSALAHVLEVLFFAAVVVFLINRLGHLVNAFQKKKRSQEAEEETESLDLHESLTPKAEAGFQEEEDDGWLSPTQRIRRLYRRRALASNFERRSLYYLTAREFSLQENNLMLSEIYEKARYSPESCDKEDLKKMQLACRRKKSE